MNTFFGIFNKLNNYELLRYSMIEQKSKKYFITDTENNNASVEVEEVCIPDIEYDENFIGQSYNTETKEFINNKKNLG